MSLKKKLLTCIFLCLSACATPQRDLSPKVYLITDGKLDHGDSEQYECNSDFAKTLACIDRPDFIYLIRECSDAMKKPWFQFW